MYVFECFYLEAMISSFVLEYFCWGVKGVQGVVLAILLWGGEYILVGK